MLQRGERFQHPDTPPAPISPCFLQRVRSSSHSRLPKQVQSRERSPLLPHCLAELLSLRLFKRSGSVAWSPNSIFTPFRFGTGLCFPSQVFQASDGKCKSAIKLLPRAQGASIWPANMIWMGRAGIGSRLRPCNMAWPNAGAQCWNSATGFASEVSVTGAGDDETLQPE